MRHATAEELETGLADVAASPSDGGTVELIVRRPAEGEREVLDEAQLDPAEGLVGDTWRVRTGNRASANPDMQLTLMNARAANLVAGTRERWPLAGDQLYVDLDLSVANLAVGTRLRVGEAIVEITAELHTGCAKFSSRFGSDALRFVNGKAGRPLRLRGVNARVVVPGGVARGDTIAKA
jgi:MOSC domain-containing protein YiiM